MIRGHHREFAVVARTDGPDRETQGVVAAQRQRVGAGRGGFDLAERQAERIAGVRRFHGDGPVECRRVGGQLVSPGLSRGDGYGERGVPQQRVIADEGGVRRRAAAQIQRHDGPRRIHGVPKRHGTAEEDVSLQNGSARKIHRTAACDHGPGDHAVAVDAQHTPGKDGRVIGGTVGIHHEHSRTGNGGIADHAATVNALAPAVTHRRGISEAAVAGVDPLHTAVEEGIEIVTRIVVVGAHLLHAAGRDHGIRGDTPGHQYHPAGGDDRTRHESAAEDIQSAVARHDGRVRRAARVDAEITARFHGGAVRRAAAGNVHVVAGKSDSIRNLPGRDMVSHKSPRFRQN